MELHLSPRSITSSASMTTLAFSLVVVVAGAVIYCHANILAGTILMGTSAGFFLISVAMSSIVLSSLIGHRSKKHNNNSRGLILSPEEALFINNFEIPVKQENPKLILSNDEELLINKSEILDILRGKMSSHVDKLDKWNEGLNYFKEVDGNKLSFIKENEKTYLVVSLKGSFVARPEKFEIKNKDSKCIYLIKHEGTPLSTLIWNNMTNNKGISQVVYSDFKDLVRNVMKYLEEQGNKKLIQQRLIYEAIFEEPYLRY